MNRRTFLAATGKGLATGYAITRGLVVRRALAGPTTGSSALLNLTDAMGQLDASGITVVETIPDDLGNLFAGGLAKWTGNGWYGSYMKVDLTEPPDTMNQIWGRQTPGLLKTWGDPDPLPGNGFDPGVIIGTGGARIVTWHKSGVGIQITKSNPTGWDTPQVLAADLPGLTTEQTIGWFLGQEMICYAWRETDTVKYKQEVRVRIGHGAYTWDPYVTATDDMGFGPAGSQQRATLSETGLADEVMCFYHHAHNGANRTIGRTLSQDGGLSFPTAASVVSEFGCDLFNPFGILLESGELRCYYQRYKAVATPKWTIGWVSSFDNGRTWGPRNVVAYPAGVNSSSRPVFAQRDDGTIACWTSWDDRGTITLGLFLV